MLRSRAVCLISVTASVKRLPAALAGDAVNYLIGPSCGGASGCLSAARAGGDENKGSGVASPGVMERGGCVGVLQGAAPPSTVVSFKEDQDLALT